MDDADRQCFTVGVFQDVAWAERGLEALKQEGFTTESFSVIGKQTPETSDLVQRIFGVDGAMLDIVKIGQVVAHGSLVSTLQGISNDLDQTGVASTMRRAGFQEHDGFIFETLTARGGVLVAVHSEPRAADALTVMFATGGGNAAIGAWSGRV